MSIHILLINTFLALALFILNGIIGDFKAQNRTLFGYSAFAFYDITKDNFWGNFINAVVHPAVYLAIVSSLFQHFSYNVIDYKLWLLPIIYCLLRIISIFLRNLAPLTNWRLQFLICLSSLLLSEGTLFFLIYPLIVDNKRVFMDLEEFRDAVWFAIIAYIAKVMWDFAQTHLIGKNVFVEEAKTRTIKRRYLKFKKRYLDHVSSYISSNCQFANKKDKTEFTRLVFAIMIYEDHNRPPWIRVLEYLKKIIFFKSKLTLGIMQISSAKLINNKQSISLAIKKLYKKYHKSTPDNRLSDCIHAYNHEDSYFDEIVAILDYIDRIEHEY